MGSRRRRPMRMAITVPAPVSVGDLTQLLEALGVDYADAEVRAGDERLEVWKRPPLEPALDLTEGTQL